MHKPSTLLTAFTLLLLTTGAFSQNPVQSIVQTNNVKALLSSNGTAFDDGQAGWFIPIEPGLAQKTLVRHAGIWLAGVGSGDTLKTALQVNGQTDYLAGVLDENGLPGVPLNNVWQVTCDDIHEDLADFQDNGLIDHPNPHIFGYPSKENPYFAQYNGGLELPDTKQALAGFYDANGDGRYHPGNGDYPSLEFRGCPLYAYPSDMRWSVFHDVTNHYSGTPALHMEIQAQFFLYKTLSPSPLNNTIFVRYKLIYRGPETLDSAFVGVYADFDIGNPNDDFMGSIPDNGILYGYNGDPLDEGGFEGEMPVMAMKVFRGPLGTPDTNGLQLPVDLSSIVIFDNSDTLTTAQCYNLLSGRKPDGSVVPGGPIMYPGNPNDPGSVSEIKAGNTPGKRAAVLSYGPFKLEPGAVNELIIAYYYVHTPGNTALQNVQTLFDQQNDLQGYFDNCFELVPNSNCELISLAPEVPQVSGLMLMPNPTQSATLVQVKSGTFSKIEVVDMLGRIVRNIDTGVPVQEYTLQTTDLQSGIYAVRVGGRVLELAVIR